MSKAKNLRYCRRKAKLTQQAFADAIGVAKSTVTAWENSKHAMPAPKTRLVANFFNVDYEAFCDEDLETLDKEKIIFTEPEIRLVLVLRRLPDRVKFLIHEVVDALYEND